MDAMVSCRGFQTRGAVGVTLTGPQGARTNYEVAIRTDDFRVYHELAPFFERNGIHLLGVAPGEKMPPAARVILGGPRDDPRSIPLRSDPEANLLAVRAALDERPTATSGSGGGYRRVTFGVDPGRTIGLAVVADERPLLVAEAHGAAEAVDRIEAWQAALRADAFVAHVGDGDPESGDAIMRRLAAYLPDLPAHLVPEEGTSPLAPATGSRHADAAILIALRKPGPSAPP